jgi:chlorite dismutase
VSDDESAPPPHERPGWAVLHLFCRVGEDTDRAAIRKAIGATTDAGHQVVPLSLLGHKADVGFMALGPDASRLRRLQSDLRHAGLDLVYSYVSRTEVSEYAAGLPEEMLEARIHPRLPPEGKPAYCFYPMTKRRAADNWYLLPYEERLQLMHGHGAVGREFRGRILQLITGSTGLDDWEWGVSLFGVTHDDLKECVYRMRFDEASARYAEFGPFLTGMVGTVDDVLDSAGVA